MIGECARDGSFSARKSFGQTNEIMMEMKWSEVKMKRVNIQVPTVNGPKHQGVTWH